MKEKSYNLCFLYSVVIICFGQLFASELGEISLIDQMTNPKKDFYWARSIQPFMKRNLQSVIHIIDTVKEAINIHIDDPTEEVEKKERVFETTLGLFTKFYHNLENNIGYLFAPLGTAKLLSLKKDDEFIADYIFAGQLPIPKETIEEIKKSNQHGIYWHWRQINSLDLFFSSFLLQSDKPLAECFLVDYILQTDCFNPKSFRAVSGFQWQGFFVDFIAEKTTTGIFDSRFYLPENNVPGIFFIPKALFKYCIIQCFLESYDQEKQYSILLKNLIAVSKIILSHEWITPADKQKLKEYFEDGIAFLERYKWKSDEAEKRFKMLKKALKDVEAWSFKKKLFFGSVSLLGMVLIIKLLQKYGKKIW